MRINLSGDLAEPRREALSEAFPFGSRIPGAMLLVVLLLAAAPGRTAASEQLQWHPLNNPQSGELMAEVPLPAGWTVTPQQWSGPGGVRAKEVMGEYFDGMDVEMDQLLDQQLLPQLQQAGNRIVAVESYPEIAEFDRRYLAQLWKVAPSQDLHAARGVVYADSEGQKGVIVVHLTRSRSQFGNSSFYTMHILEGPAKAFDQQKPVYLRALANQRHNPQQIAAHNRREQQKANASMSQFNARQRQKQQQFDNWMSTQRETSNSMMDSSMESWRRRQGMIDSGQQRQVDAIRGTAPVYDAANGQRWEVEDGHDRYFMNDSGRYIPTDDQFYNPNMDPGVNNQEWREVSPGYYGQ
ncbi:MAG: hypothetical protein KDI68_10465 [Gammaproteobacteria bacterium]|nr:hypothetical protein [Gammaproteobacteria bacterium]